MISAATAATAVVMVSLVKEHGLQYLFAATILTGIIQIAAGFLKPGPNAARGSGGFPQAASVILTCASSLAASSFCSLYRSVR
jgi:hypothetical protein